MAIPEGYTPLAKIGINYKGNYADGATYSQLDAVFYAGSTYLVLIDNPVGVPNNDGQNWRYLAQGAGEEINKLLGTTDISQIGDGTVTGAIAHLNKNGGGGQVPEMIGTYADIMANTVEGYTVDALAVKEGFNDIGIRYNPENNKVQLLVNGTWVDWMNGISYEVDFMTYNNWMHTYMAKQSGMFRTTNITSGVALTGTSVTEESFNISEEIHTLDIAGTFSNYGASYVSDVSLILEDETTVSLSTFKSTSTYSVESFNTQIDLSEYIGQSAKLRVRVSHRRTSEDDTTHLYSYINFTKFQLH